MTPDALEAALDHHLKLKGYTLVKAEGGRIYLIVDGTGARIVATFRKLKKVRDWAGTKLGIHIWRRPGQLR